MIHDCHSIAKPGSFFHVVRGQQYRSASATKRFDDLPQLQSCLRIQSSRGFVEKEQVRITNEGAGHCQPLLLAARQLADSRPPLLFERDSFNNLIYIAPARIEAAEQANRLLNGQFVRELSLLKLNTEPLAQGVVIAGAPG